MGALRRSTLGLLALAVAALALAAGAAAGPAVSTTTPLAYEASNTCTGELVTGTADVHSVFTANLSPGGVLQIKLQMTIDGFQAVGVTSGKKYVVQDTRGGNETPQQACSADRCQCSARPGAAARERSG